MLSERLRKASQPRSRNIFLFRGTIYFAIVRRRNDNLKYTISTSNSRTENVCFFGEKEIYIENMQMISIIVSK